MIDVDYPGLLLICCVIIMVATVKAWRSTLPRRVTCLTATVGVVLCTVAAGMRAVVTSPVTVRVLVDGSPGTRTAFWRDGSAVDGFVEDLRRRRPYDTFEVQGFGSNDEPYLPDPPDVDPDVDAVLLLSDGRFLRGADPRWPMMVAVLDPVLDRPKDARIVRAERRGRHVVATVRADGVMPTTLQIDGHARSRTLPPGPSIVSVEVDPQTPVTLSLDTEDRWPENDRLHLSAISSRPAHVQDVTSWNATLLPTDPFAWSDVTAAVVQGEAWADLPAGLRDALGVYLRRLGGTVLMENDPGDTDDTLPSPLTRFPDPATERWVFLVDASGSMNRPAGGAVDRWQTAQDVLTRALRQLPPERPVWLGLFADRVRWVARDAPAGSLRIPADAQPRGPTDLEGALATLLQTLPTTHQPVVTRLFLLTDGEVPIDVSEWSTRLRAADMTAHLLIVGDLAGDASLRRLSDTATVAPTQDSRKDVAREWIAAAQPEQPPIRGTLRWQGSDTARQGGVADERPGVLLPYRPSLRAGAAVVADVWPGPPADPGAVAASSMTPPAPAVAMWAVGNGRVVASAVPLTDPERNTLLDTFARPPADPRFVIHPPRHDTGTPAVLRVETAMTVSAATDLPDRLIAERIDPRVPDVVTFIDVPRVAPGRFEVRWPSTGGSGLVSLRVQRDGRTVGRFLEPSAQPAAFDVLGNDDAPLRRLSAHTGGQVLSVSSDDLSRRGTVDAVDDALPRARQTYDLRVPLSLTAVVLLAAALVAWRTGGRSPVRSSS